MSTEIQRGILTGGFATVDEVKMYLRKIDYTFKISEDNNKNQSRTSANQSSSIAPTINLILSIMETVIAGY